MDCILCSEVATAPRALPCHHAYCHLCILSVPTDVHGYSHCPACLTTFQQSLPPPNGKALLRTTHGDLEVQLFANECPKACRNFCQLILEGYYDGTALKNDLNVRWRTDSFRIDGGDRSGDDDDCESIYGAHYEDEIYSGLGWRFGHRGAMGVSKISGANGSKFFISWSPGNRAYSSSNTLFGKITANSMDSLLLILIGDSSMIISAEVTRYPFDDLAPRDARVVQMHISREIGSLIATCTNMVGTVVATLQVHDSDIASAVHNKLARMLDVPRHLFHVTLPDGSLLNSRCKLTTLLMIPCLTQICSQTTIPVKHLADDDPPTEDQSKRRRLT